MALILYGAALSPYVAKVMIELNAKGIDLPLTLPPGGTGSDEYKKLNPTGKVPALDVDGTVIPESTAIAVYLDNTQEGETIFSSDPLETAKIISTAQIADLYIGENLGALFGQMNPATRSDDILKARLEGLMTGIARLNDVIEPGPFASGTKLSFADCTIAPLLFYVTRIIPMLGSGDPLEKAPNVQAYWDAIQSHDAVAPVLEEMGKALAAMQGGG